MRRLEKEEEEAGEGGGGEGSRRVRSHLVSGLTREIPL